MAAVWAISHQKIATQQELNMPKVLKFDRRLGFRLADARLLVGLDKGKLAGKHLVGEVGSVLHNRASARYCGLVEHGKGLIDASLFSSVRFVVFAEDLCRRNCARTFALMSAIHVLRHDHCDRIDSVEQLELRSDTGDFART
jgi:hypothetical protein